MDMASAIGEIFLMCKLQIHVFSGMRNSEARHLPYHCMSPERGLHGRKHCLIAGATTKFNNGRRLRTKWVTTERDGFRAIRLAQEFAAAIYEDRGVMPSKADDLKDEHPLFPSVEYLPWMQRQVSPERRIAAFKGYLGGASDSLLSRLCPAIEEEDIAELEEIDPFRAWCEEPEFGIGRPWPLTTHQLRRSLAVYANASGLVRLSSLRRQLQHITREMTLYYGRGSTFCKNFIEDDPKGYNKHVAVEWQDGAEEAEVLAFVRDVLHSKEQMFGGAGELLRSPARARRGHGARGGCQADEGRAARLPGRPAGRLHATGGVRDTQGPEPHRHRLRHRWLQAPNRQALENRADDPAQTCGDGSHHARFSHRSDGA